MLFRTDFELLILEREVFPNHTEKTAEINTEFLKSIVNYIYYMFCITAAA